MLKKLAKTSSNLWLCPAQLKVILHHDRSYQSYVFEMAANLQLQQKRHANDFSIVESALIQERCIKQNSK